MKYIKILLILLAAANSSLHAAEESTDVTLSCPIPNFTPDEVIIDTQKDSDIKEPYVDLSRPIKDLGTDFVVKEFFSTPQSLYNFMDLVYGTLDKSLDDFKKKHGLEDRAITLLFKGGNVLRIVANGVFSMLPEEASQILKDFYEPDFKRSDADFTVYVDKEKLGGLEYHKAFSDITSLVYKDLDVIRSAFKADPKKYFDFFKLKKADAQNKLKLYFDELVGLDITKDKENETWFNAEFKQLQLLDERANNASNCDYFGQYDYKFIFKDGRIIGVPLSGKPDWIVNTDNRTLEWPTGADESKVVKFHLVRAKAGFEYSFLINGKLHRKPIGGELIDVSLPHWDDESTKEFLNNYDENVAEYTIVSPDGDDKILLKSYTVAYLAHDLLNILFGQFDRPWNGGPKYAKRVNRLFFLSLLEMLADLGLGSDDAKEYTNDLKENILAPLKSIYPLKDNAQARADLQKNIIEFATKFPKAASINDFWAKLDKLINKDLVNNPQESDEVEFNKLVEAIEKNINVIAELNKLPFKLKIDKNAVYNSDMSKLF
jgi:hypothetical protein